MLSAPFELFYVAPVIVEKLYITYMYLDKYNYYYYRADFITICFI